MAHTFRRGFHTDSFLVAILCRVGRTDLYTNTHGSQRSLEMVEKYAVKYSGAPEDTDITEKALELYNSVKNGKGHHKMYNLQYIKDAVSFWCGQVRDNTSQNLYINRLSDWEWGSDGRRAFVQNRPAPVLRDRIFNQYSRFYADMFTSAIHTAEYYPVKVLILSDYHSDNFEALPWTAELAPIPEHYARISKQFPGQVSFYETPERMEQGRRLVMKAGRYITRFYPHLNPKEIRRFATMADIYCQINYAEKAEDIIKVYTNGPNSCMARDAEEYEGGVHPVAAYESPDLKLAYIGSLEKASARALVWPEKKLVGRIYGDADRMVRLLKEAGYDILCPDDPTEEYHTFPGARLKLIPHDQDNIVAPYVDGINTGHVVDGWLVLGQGPGDQYLLQSDCGIAEKVEMVHIADIDEYRMRGWADGNCYFDETHHEYNVHHNPVYYSVDSRNRAYSRQQGRHRNSETFACDIDGRRYDNSIPATEVVWNGFTTHVPTVLVEYMRSRGHVFTERN